MKSTVLLICLAVAVGVLAATDLKSDELGKDATPSKPDAADQFIGKEAGELRDDNGLKMKLVWCLPGKFMMGSPPTEFDKNGKHADRENQVEVTLTYGFWLGKYEVSQAEWKQLMGTEPWKGNGLTNEGDDFPATYVSWDDALDFCQKLTKQERNSGRLPADWVYELPSEAQWERACRAGTETKFSFGDAASKLGEHAWISENTWDVGEKYAHQVGKKKPNSWGLYDMHGNVWEWCYDRYREKLPGGRDPEVKGADIRVIRGGGWGSGASDCRSANRREDSANHKIANCGFRVARNYVYPGK